MDKKSGFAIKFDDKFLEGLVENAEEGVYVEKSKYHLALHPAQLNDFKGALSDELGRKVGRFDTKFSGILLGFKNVKPLSTLGQIGSDNIFIHLDVEADFFIFRPSVGMILNGVVTKTAKDHVGCLVYKTFNVSLPKSEAGHEYEEQWLGSKAKGGDEVSFKIIFLELESRLPFIKGKIESINDSKSKKLKVYNKRTTFEAEDDHCIKMEPDESPTKKKKKRKHSKSEAPADTMVEEISTINNHETSLLEPDNNEKQKKKRKHSEGNADTKASLVESFTIVNSTMETPEETPRRKKKRKTSELTMAVQDHSTILEDHEEIDKSSPAQKTKHKKNSTSNELDESLDNLNYKSEDKVGNTSITSQILHEFSPQKSKPKSKTEIKEKSPEKTIQNLDKKEKTKRRTMSVAENMMSNGDADGSIDLKRRLSVDFNIENHTTKKLPKKKSIKPTESSSLDESINEVVKKFTLESFDNDISNLKSSSGIAVTENMIPKGDADESIDSKRQLSVDSNIENHTTKKLPKKKSFKTTESSSLDESINEVVKKFTLESFDNDISNLKSSIGMGNVTDDKSKIKKSEKLSKHVDETEIDLEKEREALIRRAKIIKMKHSNRFSGGNTSDSSIDRIEASANSINVPSIKRNEGQDSDSSIEKIRKNQMKIKREVKTPAKEVSPMKVPSIESDKGNSNDVIDKRKEKDIKRGVKTHVREAAKENNREVKKSKLHGIVGSMSDWEVEDFSQIKKAPKKTKNMEVKEETIKIKEKVFSDTESLKKSSKRKEKKEKRSQSFSLNEDDLNNLFASPSTKLEPKTDDEETVKKKRKRSLSRSIDFKDIRMEPNSDIDNTESFSFAKNKSLNDLGLHTEVDLGIKEDGDILEQLGIS